LLLGDQINLMLPLQPIMIYFGKLSQKRKYKGAGLEALDAAQIICTDLLSLSGIGVIQSGFVR